MSGTKEMSVGIDLFKPRSTHLALLLLMILPGSAALADYRDPPLIHLNRFVVNTTVGIVGIFDPADTWLDMERRVTSAGDMLLEMPLNTIEYLVDKPEGTVVQVSDNFQLYAPMIQSYIDITAESEDPYIFMRNLHIQGIQRDAAYPRE